MGSHTKFEKEDNKKNLSSKISLDRVSKDLLAKGHLVIHELFSEVEVDFLLNEIEASISIADNVHIKLDSSVNDEPLVVTHLDKYSRLLGSIHHGEMLEEISRRYLGIEAIPLHIEYFCKPPKCKVATDAHQDHSFYNSHFHDELALSIWVALDDIDKDMAPIEFLDKSINYLLPHVESDESAVNFKLSNNIDGNFRPVTLRKGDAIIFHSLAIHRSGVSSSSKTRRALVFNFRGSPYKEWCSSL